MPRKQSKVAPACRPDTTFCVTYVNGIIAQKFNRSPAQIAYGDAVVDQPLQEPERCGSVVITSDRRVAAWGALRANWQPYEVKAGKLHIPDVPGIGLEWDEKAVAAHLADF
jgi:hypothetical protein